MRQQDQPGQFALSPFPRRRSRKSCTPGRDTTSSSAPSTPTPTPKTRSVGIQTPVLQRRGLSGLGDPPSHSKLPA
ncbi:hypothetical protein Pcinc_032766 [Petrolisthes cinctipes]|uniref:Uncharacterized protein n=1 Tax=Petrolisthes cinctipes TaxID=88211 RepID=A0AAE1ETF6_PETCI|nr:hypothetical protein Pcinc_032766 [Petrolisthes cinctipes]